jgi:competence protein ComEC
VREPLLLPFLALAGGIVLSHAEGLPRPDSALAFAGFLLLCLLALWKKIRWATWTCGLLAAFSIGAWLDAWNRPGPAPQLDTPDSTPVIIAGCVVEPSDVLEDHETFTLELDPGARARVNLYRRDGEPAHAFRYGQHIEIEAKIRTPHNFNNPGSFDNAGYLARQQIFWTATASPYASVTIQPGVCGSPFWSGVYQLRTAALRRIDTLYAGDDYNTGMMEAVLIGDSARLQKSWTDDYRTTGTFHALIISGTHVALLAGLLIFLLRICFVPQTAAILATVPMAWAYALITGMQAPCVRSAAGISLFAIARVFYRRARILNILAAVAIGFVFYDPSELFDASFQLSFISVALIGAFVIPIVEVTTGPFAQALRQLGDRGMDLHVVHKVAQFRVELRLLAETVTLATRLPIEHAMTLVSLVGRGFVFLADLLLTSAVIQVGLALPMAIFFHRVSATGVSANAFAVPLLGVVIPIGFVSLFTGWHVPAGIAAYFLELSRRAVAFHAAYEPDWRIPDAPLWLAIAICVALMLAGTRTFHTRTRWSFGVLALLCILVQIAHPFPPVVQAHALEMDAIDVGQGDSLFLAFPDGKLLLVDTGGIAQFGKRRQSNLDIGEGVVSTYLWTRSIKRIDVVAVSHAHQDHVGGLRAVLTNFHPRELWIGAEPECDDWRQIRRMARELGVAVKPLRQGNGFDYGGAHIDVLAPVPDYVPSNTPKNNDSLVMRVAWRKVSFLLTGDMEKPIENELVANGFVSHADVLKVGHHGSKTSTTPLFLDQVHPALAVISDGYENSYGHPHPTTLAELEDRHIPALRTDRMGLIRIWTDGYRLRCETASQQ